MPDVEVNGIRLHVERSGDGLPVVFLHGFTGSGETWASRRAALDDRFATVAIDLIGHGRSDAPADPARYGMAPCVEDLTALFDELEIECAAVVGYSMGGRIALYLALAAPERVALLALEGASPGIVSAEERAARVRSDEALAALIERDGLVAFVDRWERVPLFATQERLPLATRQRVRAQRLRSNPVGLANSLRGMGAGAMEPVWDRLSELRMPALLLAGELDPKYREIGRRMAAAMPDARLAIVPDAGHAAHLEQPEAFERAVLSFLREVGG